MSDMISRKAAIDAPSTDDPLATMISDLSHTGELSMLYRMSIADAITEMRAENARLRGELTYATQHDTQDELTPLIHEDQRSPGYWSMYGTAIEYVSNRKSKSALVHLVTYILRRSEEKAQ